MLLVLIFKNNLPFTVNNLNYYLLQNSQKFVIFYALVVDTRLHSTRLLFPKKRTKQQPLGA